MNQRNLIKILLGLIGLVILFHLSIILKIVPYDIAWGGRLTSDEEMYVFEGISIAINFFLVFVLLLKGAFIKQWFPMKIINGFLWVFLALFALNTVGNIIAKTTFEKFFAVVTLLFALLLWFILKKGKTTNMHNFIIAILSSCVFLACKQKSHRDTAELYQSSFELYQKDKGPKNLKATSNKFELAQKQKRENGFYATTNYSKAITDEDIELEDKPALSPKDILKASKGISNITNQPEINIQFTEEGADKLYRLTNENIGKPIAIVIENKVISMPFVHSAIKGGRISINGDFSMEEIDNIIEKLR